MEYNTQNLLELYNRGLTYSAIAKEFGTTRASVIGKMRRLKVKDSTIPTRLEKKNQYVATKESKPVVVKPSSKYLAQTVIFKNHRHGMSKAEMYDMLRKAVENTK